ncbi:MAG TPA: lycopene cyclase domain-containing protein, partial [Aggregatilineales bacterium]|nr:lycopene cyclase domain-containing protein [Aggregatilineales bacterium]
IMRRMPPSDAHYSQDPKPRLLATGALGIVWLASLRKMFEGKPKNTYQSLIMAWAIPPIMLQTGFGGDIMWRNRKAILTTILASTAYLGVSDSLSIGEGTWGINPEKTIGVDVIPNLPFEEFFFFFITNVLLTFGVTLVMSKESENRLPAPLRPMYTKFKARWLKRGN